MMPMTRRLQALRSLTVLLFGLCLSTQSAWSQGEDLIDMSEIGEEERITFSKSRKDKPKRVYRIQQQRGVIRTGLMPLFDNSVQCRNIDSEVWAKDYSHKRGKPAHHKGIDIPAPRGTPILAVAKGTVVGKFLNQNNAKGIEIVLRHAPDDTGLPFWSYSQYTHLLELPEYAIGSTLTMGERLGKTSNSGISGREARSRNSGGISAGSGKSGSRRNALHFAVFYSESPQYSATKRGIVPLDGYFMDPNAFYRQSGPYDSVSMQKLAQSEKHIKIPYMLDDGRFFPEDSKVVWPYSCSVR